jgi:hypothetical protein
MTHDIWDSIIPSFGMEYLGPSSGLDYMIHIVIKADAFINHDPIYFFDITPEGFGHMFGEIDEYPGIEYVDKINEDDNDDRQDGRLRIIGVDIL